MRAHLTKFLGAIVASCIIALAQWWGTGQVPAKYYKVLVSPRLAGVGVNNSEMLERYGRAAGEAMGVATLCSTTVAALFMVVWLGTTWWPPSDPWTANKRVVQWIILLLLSVFIGALACFLVLDQYMHARLWPFNNIWISFVSGLLGTFVIYVLVGTLVCTPKELSHVIPTRAADYSRLWRFIRRRVERDEQS